jgi:hypothetical protein
LQLRGVLGEGGFVKIPNERGPKQFRLSVNGRSITPEPIEQWLLSACPLVKDVALTSRLDGDKMEGLPGPKLRRRAGQRPRRHIVAFATEVTGVARKEAEEAMLLLFARLPVWQRPKRIVWTNMIPRIVDETGAVIDRRRLSISARQGKTGRFHAPAGEDSIARLRGSRLKTPPVLGAVNEWRFEGFLKYHPHNSRVEFGDQKAVILRVAHIDEKTGEERVMVGLVSDKKMLRTMKLKRGDRIIMRGHMGSLGRAVVDDFKLVASGIEKIPFHDQKAMIGALA